MFTNILALIIFVDYLVNYSQITILKAWNNTCIIQKEFEFILSELEEAIITKDTVNNQISYSNKRAKIILEQISPNLDDQIVLKSKIFKLQNNKG